MPDNQAERRITTQAVTCFVSVTADTKQIGETRRAVRLDERGYRPCFYIPRDAIADGALVESETRTYCPYKGDACYYHVIANGQTYSDAAWSYDEPLSDVGVIAGRIAFDHPAIRVDLRD